MARLVVGHRQQRERAGRVEDLVGDMLVRPLVAKHRDDRLMVVAPARDADSGRLARRRIAAVGGDQQRRAAACGRRPATRRRRDRRARRRRRATSTAATMFAPASARACSAARRWRFSCIQPSGSSSSGSKCSPPGSSPSATAIAPDRAAGLGQVIGNADRLEHPHRARRDRAGAAVECGVARAAPGRPGRRRSPTGRCESSADGQRQPDHPAAEDDHVRAIHGAAVTARGARRQEGFA